MENSLTIEDALKIFIKWSSLRGLSDETIRGYTIDSRQFVKWLAISTPSTTYITEITDQQIEDFMYYLVSERKCCPATVNRKLNTLEMLFRCMKRKKFIIESPMEEIDRMKVHVKEMTYLTQLDMHKILKAIEHPILHYFALTMAYTGIRINECRTLKIKDINFIENHMNIINGKGGKHRTIPLNPYLTTQLTTYLQHHRPDTHSPYFFALKRSGSVSTQYVNRALLIAARKAGIQKHITSHALRHSFATYLVKQNTNIVIIQKLLGHASLKTTSVYLHVEQDEMKEAVGRIEY